MGHKKIVQGPIEVGDDYIIMDQRKKKRVNVV